jgi:hypothetical protein
MMTQSFGRIATFLDWEHQVQVAPDVWDVDPARRCQVTEKANQFLERHQVQVMPPVSYEVKLIEQRDGGRRRIYLHTLAIVSIPKEIITDGSREPQSSPQTQKAEIPGPAEIGKEIRFKDPNELGQFLNRFGVDPNAFAAASGGLPLPLGSGSSGPAAEGVPLPGSGPSGSAPPSTGG